MEALEKILLNVIANPTEKIVADVFANKDLQKFIVFQNKFQLYVRGVDGNGNFLGHYRPSTYVKKYAAGQRSDHITLYDTGEYYESKQLYITPDEFQLVENASKGDKSLYERFGTEISGWDDVSMENIVAAIGIAVENRIRKIFNIPQTEYIKINYGNTFTQYGII